MADYITDTGLAAVVCSGLDGDKDTRSSSLPGFREECPVSPAVAPLDAQVHTTPVRATEQAARTIVPAAALRSEHDGGQDSPPSNLPVIRNERPASPAIPTIDEQVHRTSVRAAEQTALTSEQPPTTLPAPTEPAAPGTPPRLGLLHRPVSIVPQTTPNRHRPKRAVQKHASWMKII